MDEKKVPPPDVIPSVRTQHDSGNSKVPDGGYGWVIVVCCFGAYFTSGGTYYTHGLYYPEFLATFGAGEVVTAWASALQASLSMASALLMAPLVDVFGHRAMAMTGSLLCAAGLLISAYAPTIGWLYLGFGCVTGVGMCAQYMGSVVIVQHYFHKKRPLAIGLASAGSGSGAFAYTHIFGYLLERYGWRNCLVIQAALTMQCIVFGALLRPLPPESSPSSGRASVSEPPTDGDPDKAHESPGKSLISSTKELCQKLRRSFDFSIMKEPTMWFMVVALFIMNVGCPLPYLFTPSKAAACGLSPGQISLALSFFGLFDTVGRISFGIVGSFCSMDRVPLLAAAIFVCGFSTALSGMAHVYPLLLLYGFVYGLFMGFYVVLQFTVQVDLLGVEALSRVLGITTLSCGLGVMVSGPLAAFIYEKTANYDLAFTIMGSVQACGGLLLFVMHILLRMGVIISPAERELFGDIDLEMDMDLALVDPEKVMVGESVSTPCQEGHLLIPTLGSSWSLCSVPRTGKLPRKALVSEVAT